MIPGAQQARGQIGADGNGGGNNNGNGGKAQRIPFVLTLMKNPKSLHVLWQEYEFKKKVSKRVFIKRKRSSEVFI